MATRKRLISTRATSTSRPRSQNPTPQVRGSNPDLTPEEQRFERKEQHLYDDIKGILVDLNSRMEDDPDVYELIDQLDEIKENAKVKQFELELLETLAWMSNETAVVDARKNLFTATKLSHYQFIAEAIDSWKEDNFMFEDGYGDDCAAEPEEDFVSRHNWIQNFSNFIQAMRNRGYRKKNTREQIKQYIQHNQN